MCEQEEPSSRGHHPSKRSWLFVLLAISLVGCASDPLVGTWEARTENITAEFVIDDDLRGDGTAFVQEDGGFTCHFDVDAEPEGGGDYELEFRGRRGCSLDEQADVALDGDRLLFDVDEDEWPRVFRRR